MENKHWIQGDCVCESPLFRRIFTLEALPQAAWLEICGLGYFLLYANGRRVGEQEFVPAPTNYSSVLGCEAGYPVWEERRTYRCQYLTFDLLPYLRAGENALGVQLGNGWYHQTRRTAEGKFIFGWPKLRYELHLLWQDGSESVIESDSQTQWRPSEIADNNLFYGERHDLRLRREDWCLPESAGKSGEKNGAQEPEQERAAQTLTEAANEPMEEPAATVTADEAASTAEEASAAAKWQAARPTHAPQSLLTEQTCPADRVLRRVQPVLLRREGACALYDCGENLAGRVVVRCHGESGMTVRVRHSEELTADGAALDFASAGGEGQIQEDVYVCAGLTQTAWPKFCWHAFRYFTVEGAAEPEAVEVIGTPAAVVSSFRCSDPTLNWLYESYLRTQQANYHGCIPSDCPHRERLGYTGDGQLTAQAAMMTMEVRALYEKWYQDILDSQGGDSGHIPHTAPFLGGGGGPGGWGGAVYLVPLRYYQVYGDTALLEKGYEAIVRWLDYMESRSEDGLVVAEEAGGWCLGEWCAPAGAALPPEPYVNTYFYIGGLRTLRQTARLLGRQEPSWLEKRLRRSEGSLVRAYFDEASGDFCGGIGAANAYALRLGLGDARTARNLTARYSDLSRLDTGIFGTPLLLEQLFAQGEAELAYRILTGDGPLSFARMRERGATTLWETWEGDMSHNHPMFGSVVPLLFTEILGVRTESGTVQERGGAFGTAEAEKPAADTAKARVTVRPAEISALRWAEGTVRTASGLVSVRWERGADGALHIEKKEGDK